MFDEALARINDADILAGSLDTQSDASAVLRILGFEILLKCAIQLSGQSPRRNHAYAKLWLALPGHAQTEILKAAKERSPGHTDFSDLNKLLTRFQFVFEKARYHYELYDGWTPEEMDEFGKLWEELGAPTEEAMVQYHPEELFCLIEALKVYIAPRL
ncbi:hypothetical protein AZ34_10815 [Hylemonella gracilis str. Niagara R]|uniref:HEPN domain-containing protein n=2 Tax=Hylemonella gracilis TaxID=80880 RepID=A0A016XL99_9BURK|nr:hypothetical protein AZ34_10815 [Hylemonella gracilis str. Niagara R]